MKRRSKFHIVRYGVYYFFLRYLPPSTVPGGRMFRRARFWVCRGMFKACGEDVNIESRAFFGSGRQVSIGNRSGIGVRSYIFGPVSIGSDVMMGPEVLIYTANHRSDRLDVPMLQQGNTETRPVTIQDDVWIGARAVILAGVTIGKGSIVGAAAVVSRDVAPFSVIVGNPARVVRSRAAAEPLSLATAVETPPPGMQGR